MSRYMSTDEAFGTTISLVSSKGERGEGEWFMILQRADQGFVPGPLPVYGYAPGAWRGYYSCDTSPYRLSPPALRQSPGSMHRSPASGGPPFLAYSTGRAVVALWPARASHQLGGDAAQASCHQMGKRPAGYPDRELVPACVAAPGVW